MSGAAKEFEKSVLEKSLVHDGNPILRWMAGNVSVVSDAAGNIKPNKAVATGKIDGIVAAIMGVGRAATSTEPRWFYENNKLEMG
jgi:phage terminase large subunit-like protein